MRESLSIIPGIDRNTVRAGRARAQLQDELGMIQIGTHRYEREARAPLKLRSLDPPVLDQRSRNRLDRWPVRQQQRERPLGEGLLAVADTCQPEQTSTARSRSTSILQLDSANASTACLRRSPRQIASATPPASSMTPCASIRGR